MLNLYTKRNICKKPLIQILIYKYSQIASEPSNIVSQDHISVIDTKSLPNDDFINLPPDKISPLDECTTDISHVAPYIKPTFNFASYINKSETLQQLLKLGVNLHLLERKITVPQFILGLDFEKDIKQYVTFFHDMGLTVDEIGSTITNNPYILKQDIDDLKVRINYLLYKKFSEKAILRILQRNPFWLMFSTERIDRRLGFFQKEYSLTGNEVRILAEKQPKLITYSISRVKLNNFALKEEMGFSSENLKRMILDKPNILMKSQEKMLLTYEYIINVMKLSLETIANCPELLTCREVRIRERHMFMQELGRAQYNPKLPNYVSVLTLVSGSDGDFAVDVAKSSLQAYNAFLKTL